MKIESYLCRLGLAVLVVLALLMGPAQAGASETEILLSENMSEPLVVETGRKVVLDLGAWNLTVNRRNSHTITVQEGGELVVKGSTGQVSNAAAGKCALVNYGTVTIQGGNFTHGSVSQLNPIIENYGTLYIEGGRVFSDSPYGVPVVNRKGLAAVSGGTLEQTAGLSIINENGAILMVTGTARIHGDPNVEALQNAGTAVISGGQIRGLACCYGAGPEKTVLEISGGEIEANGINVIRYPSAADAPEVRVTGVPVLRLATGFHTLLSDENHVFTDTRDKSLAAVSVEGGIFSAPVSPDYWAETVTQVRLEDGRYGFQLLTAENAAAKVEAPDGNPAFFHSLEKAASAAPDGGVVTLLMDAAAELTVPEGRNITINLGGHTLAGRLINSGTLTIHSGTIAAVEGSAVFLRGGADFTASDDVAITSLTDSAVTAVLEEAGKHMRVAISEKAALSSAAGHHLVEVVTPEEPGEWEVAYRDLTRQIPVSFLHTPVLDPGMDPSCTSDGRTAGLHCAVCGAVLEPQMVIPAKGHAPEPFGAPAAATCTAAGLSAGSRCAVCGLVLAEPETLPALGHVETVREAAPASCTEDGLTEGVYCSICGEVLRKQAAVPALGHVETVREAVPAACTEDGLTEGVYCSVCGEVLREQAAVPAIGHMAVGLEAVPPSCTDSGLSAGAVCEACHAVLTPQAFVPALGHDYGRWIVTIAATCGAEGLETRSCLRNPNHQENRAAPATGNHVWDAGLVVKRPDSLHSGVQIFTCLVCNASETKTMPPVDAPGVPAEPDEVPGIPDVGVKPDETPETPPSPTPDPPVLANPVLPDNGAVLLASDVFRDVDAGAWYDEAVGFVSSLGLMTGTGADSFSPEGNMTRAMLWTVLGRMDGADVDGTGKSWYAKAQAWSVKRGISDGTMADGFISREQLVTMLWRYCGEPDGAAALDGFKDAASISEWSQTAVQWAVSTGLLQGAGGLLRPGGNASRAEVAAILMRFCQNMPA